MKTIYSLLLVLLINATHGLAQSYHQYDLFPLTQGSSWTYDDGKSVKVTKAEDANGILSVEITNLGDYKGSATLRADDEDIYLMNGSQSMFIMGRGAAHFPLVKIPLTMGLKWKDNLVSNGYDTPNTCTVTATNITVVAAGKNYNNCTELNVDVDFSQGYTPGQTKYINKKYYFLPGVGCIKTIWTSDKGSTFILQAVSWDIKPSGPSKPPQITQQTGNVTVPIGGSATFAVTATGSEPLTYQWRKDRINLVNGGRVSGATSSTLIITNAQAADRGGYDVVVSNSVSAVTSSSGLLEIITPSTDTVRLLDYFYPIQKGNWWVYRLSPASGSVTNRLVRVESASSPITAYTGRNPARSYTTNVVSLYFADVQRQAGVVTYTDGSWYEYVSIDQGWAYWGFDDDPGTVPDPDEDRVRFDKGTFVPDQIKIGQTVNHNRDVYEDGTFIKEMAFTFRVMGRASLAVPAKTFDDCLHIRLTHTMEGAPETWDEWWAKGVGMIKKTRTDSHGRPETEELYEYYIAPQLPRIVAQPSNRTTALGSTATFTVEASSVQPLTYQWRKNDANLVDGGRISGANSAVLSIANCQTTDAGIYSVNVQNSLGSVTSSLAQLTVIEPPQLICNPHVEKIAAGTAVNFRADASGASPLQYRWLKDGTPLPGQTNPVLSLPNPQPSDSGAYVVVVSNAAGSISCQVVSLEVLIRPAINQQPQSANVVQGKSTFFQTTATGSSPLQYQWFKDGTLLQGNARFTGANSQRLEILNTTTNDAGVYYVKVSNAVGETNSSQASLAVLVPPWIVGPPVHQTTVQNGGATFTVQAGGTSPLSYEWKRNGAVLRDGAGVSGSQTPTLILSSLSTNDSGAQFLVTVSNTAGSMDSPPATLTVVLREEAPQIVRPPADQAVPLGQTATFTAQVTGWPAPVYQWRFKGSNLSNGEHISGADTPVLRIVNVSLEDEGAYSLLVSNPLGSTSSPEAVLRVVLPPQITGQPLPFKAVVGERAQFMVEVSGTPPLAFQWRWNQEALSAPNSMFLAITNVQLEHAGHYDVVVTNLAGAAYSAAAVLEVAAPPLIAQQPRNQTNCAGGTVSFSVTAHGTEPLGYHWWKDGELVSQSPILERASLDAERDAGFYQVVITNWAGSVTSALAQLVVKTPPRITAQPESTAVIPGGTAQFSVLAQGTEPIHCQWRFNGADLPGQTNRTLVLSNVQTNQAGGYAARLVNECGLAESQSATLLVVNRALQVASTHAAPGASVEVPITLVSAGDENRVALTFEINQAAARVDTPLLGAAAANATLVSSNLADGRLWMQVSLPPNQVFEAGLRELMVVRLTLESTWTQEAVLLMAMAKDAQVLNTTDVLLPCDLVNGTLAVRAAQPVLETPNQASGLFEGALTLAVPHGGIPSGRALMVVVHDLGKDAKGFPIEVYNQAGTTNGVPFVLARGPLAGGTALDLLVQFIVRDRVTVPHPRYELLEVPVPLPPALTGAAIPIPPETVRYVNGAFYLKFPTKAGKTYYVQYTRDLANPDWKIAYPPLTGNGGWVVWRDAGPPGTDTKPEEAAIRFFQAMEAQ